MKTMLPFSKKKKKRTGLWLALFVIAFVGLVFFNSSVNNIVSSALYPLASPFIKSGQAIKNWWGNNNFIFKNKRGLSEQNSELRSRTLELESRQLTLDFLKEENERLKAMLSQTENREYALASIISRPPQMPYDTLIVDAGSENGIEVGMTVTAYSTALVGYVDEVFQDTAKVKLISFPSEETNGILDAGDLAVLAVGKGGGNMEINLPNSIEVKSGDRVMTADTFPLVLGFVESVEISLSDPFQKILFRFPVNLQELKYVMIEKYVAPVVEIKEEGDVENE